MGGNNIIAIPTDDNLVKTSNAYTVIDNLISSGSLGIKYSTTSFKLALLLYAPPYYICSYDVKNNFDASVNPNLEKELYNGGIAAFCDPAN